MKCILLLYLSFFWSITNESKETLHNSSSSELIGTWDIDFSPENTTDDWGTILTIQKVTETEIKGVFYNSKTREGRVALRGDIVHFAFVTSDAKADYNTSGRFEKGILYGSTHSLGRDFIAPWTGTKIK